MSREPRPLEMNTMSDFRTPAWLLGPGRPQADLRLLAKAAGLS